MLLIELNEFSPSFLRQASEGQDTPTLDKVLSWQHCQTDTADKQERFGLDPWVQWVSIHTGVASKQHGIAHLAEADKLTLPQIWDVLNDRGISATVWGPMNGRNNAHSNLKTFFPDPWTFSESAAPTKLNWLLALPRFYAQNYIKPKWSTLLLTTLKTSAYLLFNHPVLMLKNVWRWLAALFRYGAGNATFFAIFDNLCAKLFVARSRSDGSEFKLIFLNSIAHLQHHKWQRDHPEVVVSIKLLEDTLTTILESAEPGEPVLLTNAFSQERSFDKEEYLYRPIDPVGFIRAAELPFSHVEQMMTNDGHIFFASEAEADAGEKILAAATIEGEQAFAIERRGPLQLFYQFIVWQDLPPGSQLNVNGLALDFYSLFEKVTRRSGSHISRGDIYCRDIELPAALENHQLFQAIDSYYA